MQTRQVKREQRLENVNVAAGVMGTSYHHKLANEP
jgi:hypothetical protein